MVNLIDLLDFATQYFYTKTTDKNLFKDYLSNVVYRKGSLYINVPIEDVEVTQECTISIEDNKIIFDFNYLPLTQEVLLEVNNKNVTTNISREMDTFTYLMQGNVNKVHVRVSTYTDSTGVVYTGLENIVTYEDIFSSPYIVNESNQWWLYDEDSFNINSLTCSNGVTLTNYTESSSESKARVVFSNNLVKSFTITKNDVVEGNNILRYNPCECRYVNGGFLI